MGIRHKSWLSRVQPEASSLLKLLRPFTQSRFCLRSARLSAGGSISYQANPHKRCCNYQVLQ
ncbi:uncharacterized protein TRIVIDRAFT_186107 [Trichoderma virens Gv29-8]|uniref:Uncharacterized protein n=1 Tax=Hypocrea virens (strain Gv29-8 / FGSC 10586) TaxID=413071 RepID=G9ML88_HYPVG|nr:uncharacterized protein TRIVIDRAFT_186107 [Trichoderma virens Gv29-8]EHK24981.1 hypothetical protein TRIVIDRAFT_186107 [Trichoderma virens Gv29-8]